MYQPKYSISHKLLLNIAKIEGCKALIENAALVPAWETKFQEEAVARTVHYGTHLEGNKLDLQEASAVVRNTSQMQSQQRDIQEVINYRNVLNFLETREKELKNRLQLAVDGEMRKKIIRDFYRPEILQTIHHLIMDRLLPVNQSGEYRQEGVVVRDESSGKIIFMPPPALEVSYQIEDFFQWLQAEKSLEIHPVIKAGVTHFELVRIHPFLDGNGRAARAMATLVLFAENYDIRKLFALEEYFDKQAVEYYQALRSVEEKDGDLTLWLEFFTEALVSELEKVKKEVVRLSRDLKMKGRLGQQVALSERQIKLVDYLQDFGQMTMSEAERVMPMVSRDTILRDLKELVAKGVLKKRGRTKGVVYLMR